MEYIDGKKVQEAGDGDIIIADKEPYVIDDEAILNEIKWMRDHHQFVSHVGDTRIEILEDFRGKVLRKTKVSLTDVSGTDAA